MLHIENVRSTYGRVEALKGVTLTITEGETVSLVGSNGAGKTTLLRAISGVQPISAGEIRFRGENISHMRPRERLARGIAQSPEGRQVFGPMTVEENLIMGAFCRPRVSGALLESVYAMFPVLEQRRASLAGALSGGQQQMLAIGRAFMAEPDLLILDEPSLGLSPLLVGQIFQIVVALRAQGKTILLVEQNASAALAISDRGYVLKTGEISHEGPASALLADETIRDAYLGGPN
jgi:branched-chain amino acid transport system ATP-binding protein